MTTSLPNATIDNTGGTLNINADATGSSVNVEGITHFGASQTLASLTIAAGGVATLLATPAPDFGAPAFPADGAVFAADESGAGAGAAVEAVPEPGSLGLLAFGALGLLGRRVRRETSR